MEKDKLMLQKQDELIMHEHCFGVLKKTSIYFLILIIVPLLAIAGHSWKISGKYKGKAEIEDGFLRIWIKGINKSNLTDYDQVRPYTKGNRVFLYFDMNNNKTAEFCGFIYKQSFVLKKATSPGFFNKAVYEIKTNSKGRNFKVDIPIKLFDGLPVRLWTTHMKAVY